LEKGVCAVKVWRKNAGIRTEPVGSSQESVVGDSEDKQASQKLAAKS